MNHMNYKEALERLRRSGFTEQEIVRLSRFRRKYVENEMDHASADLCRLKFIRWLVETGRLKE